MSGVRAPYEEFFLSFLFFLVISELLKSILLKRREIENNNAYVTSAPTVFLERQIALFDGTD